jgi:putative addiction module CopG family antidote
VSLASWGIATKGIRTTNIKLNPEQEKTIKDELQSGHFRNVEEVIAEALQALREKERLPSASRRNGEQRDAVREMLAFVEKNHARLDAVSVKELIHEGHRL